jgi:hypothetical protein
MLSEHLLRSIIDERERELHSRIRIRGLLGGRRHPSRPHAETGDRGPTRDATAGGADR